MTQSGRGRRPPESRRRASSSPRAASLEARLRAVFLKVREFASGACPELARATLSPNCQKIHFERRTQSGFAGERAYMHAGHLGPSGVCAVRTAAALSDSHLVGLFLHELGHVAGGESEPAANDWVREKLGVEIEYRAPLDLQWVSPEVCAKILR